MEALADKKLSEIEMYDKISLEIRSTYLKKNHDYGNSFDKSIDIYGFVAALVRMSDKMERLTSLLVNKNEAQVEEKADETACDLANYAIMLVSKLRRSE